MGSRLNPYSRYNGIARQAMAFCQEVRGGALEMGTGSDLGSPDSTTADKLMHAKLTPQAAPR